MVCRGAHCLELWEDSSGWHAQPTPSSATHLRNRSRGGRGLSRFSPKSSAIRVWLDRKHGTVPFRRQAVPHIYRLCVFALLPGQNNTHAQAAIGFPRVAAAILALPHFVEIIHSVGFGQIAGLFQTLQEIVSLYVNMRRRDVRNLARVAAQANPLIVDRGPDPYGPAVGVGLSRAPEADVVSLSRVVAHRLLEGQVLSAPNR